MKAEALLKIIDSDFYSGVPDSQLRALCDCLMEKYGTDTAHHVIAANEGSCTAIAAGYHLATGKTPVVYLQNSGEGNVINPLASLLNEKVYAIPMLFIVGWRGEPGVHDEPQHIYQGQVTVKLMEDMGVKTFIIGRDTKDEEVSSAMVAFRKIFALGGQAAFIVRKGALSHDSKISYSNSYGLIREDAIRAIAKAAGADPVVSTTGKISRELFEIREAMGQGHEKDFLTVGSMGHCSSIALGVALARRERRIWCIDGDGAVLMHMGAMAVIGSSGCKNLVHIVLNNEAHETVGGMPTVAGRIDLKKIAASCGYDHCVCVKEEDELLRELEAAAACRGTSFIEVKCAIGSRENLGRPTTGALDNKNSFMDYLKSCQR